MTFKYTGPPYARLLGYPFQADAKQKVMDIIRRIGARAFDGGPWSNAYVIEGISGVIIYLNRKYKSKHGSIKITGIDETVAR